MPNIGGLTKAGVPTTGVAQVETAQLVGTITLAGTAELTVTSALVVGSPLVVNVDVALNDTATLWAVKAAAALNATAAVAAHYVASSSVANVILTAIKSAANDATLNIAYTNGTCTGITPDSSSENTTAGVKGDYRGADYGVMVADTTNSNLYFNTGSIHVPVWTLL